jgi:hypothetical protein
MSAQIVVSSKLYDPVVFISGEKSRYSFLGERLKPRAGLDIVEKPNIPCPAGN